MVKTVADTKQAFFALFTRPLNSVYRRVIDELLVEVHLLTVHHQFRYDPFFGLGLVTLYERFLDGYFPKEDKAPIFAALAGALGFTDGQLQRDAQAVQQTSAPVLLAALQEGNILPTLPEAVQSLVQAPLSKYSRIFALGLTTALEPHLQTQLEAKRTEIFDQICTRLGLNATRVRKDLDFYSQALDQVRKSKEAMEEANESVRKKRQPASP
ncbi:photosystem II biogenesis protein Psp29 [Candidatus Cyanaurora vandensis]|uniref:photosystem II biogenesis protein Psp29 n=1 Tax=Candidatus Cyanaurora vandensis TaxID=2714958 RepID=UPI00257BC0E8|nr:photosystem II biogenesis protein Psp29 [Candidatus Cyanaurora vandensis]